jgi:hypothetical protein
MVDLATGDFTYNIPLLEVPGPEGGYPLALSYHAGISPEEEASWVGLGWSLNAGAINRIVNIHPDDMKNETIAIHDTWSGGETKIYSVGLGVGIGNAVRASVGVDFAHDTYKGNGIGVHASVGVNGESGLGVGVQAGLGPYGGGYVGVALNGGIAGDGASVSGSIGLTANFSDGNTQLAGNAGASVSYDKGYAKGKDAEGKDYYKKNNSLSLLGADISTNSSRPSFSPAGISTNVISDNSKNITSISSGGAVQIPIPYTPLTIDLGYQYNRYYIDAYDHEEQLGVLYANAQSNDIKQSFDSYYLKSNISANPFFDTENDPSGGSIPAYDSYNVVAQGMSGAIQPYLFEGGTITRKLQWNNPAGDNWYYPSGTFTYDYGFKPYDSNKKVSFRFINEFSNSMVLNADNLSGGSINDYKINDENYDIGIGHLNYDDNNSKDFNSNTGALAGTKHVEWFTNQEITNAFNPGTAGDYPNRSFAKGFIPNITNRDVFFSDGVYGVNIADNIGGFMITNASGVNYHYAQPVYNFEETQVLYCNSSSNGDSYRRIEKPIPYAYSWLLTGVTGPDYVDRGIIGQIDEADWGYWVKFEYGKWTDQYIWRTPNDGTDKDNWSEWQSYTAGKKELYYLNAIVTRTHTALFVKDTRKDSKGIKDKDAGGFGLTKNDQGQLLNCSTPSLRLSRILLYSNRVLSKAMEEDLSININAPDGTPKILASTRDELNAYGTGQPDPLVPVAATSSNRRIQYHENVLTEKDLINPVSHTSIDTEASRQIVFNHDYTLCQDVPNNIDIDYASLIENQPVAMQEGKLTLNSINFLGYGAKRIVPPTSFTYYNPASYQKDKKDVWGMYKSDADPSSVEQVYQRTTALSANNVHAWSLTGINTNIGAEIDIEYESDKYKTVVVNPNFNISGMTVAVLDSPKVRIFTHNTELLTNMTELITPNVRVKYVVKNDVVIDGGTVPLQSSSTYKDIVVAVVNVADNYIDVQSDEMYASFKTTSKTVGGHGISEVQNTIHSIQALNVLFSRSATTETYGGGLRVKSISLKADNIINKTNYTYSSGVTAYEPFDLNVNLKNGATLTNSDDLKTLIGTLYKEYYVDITANSSFLPSPGVIYQQVTVKDQVLDISTSPQTVMDGLSYTSYKFMTFNQNMMPRTEDGEINIAQDQYVKKVKLRDFRNFIGALQEIAVYSSANDGLLTLNQNSYLHDVLSDYKNDYADSLSEKYNNQGRIEHLYYEDKRKHWTLDASSGAYSPGNEHHLLITEIEEYPVVLMSNRVLNNKTNISKENKTIAFDYYTGNPMMSWYKDGMGNNYLTNSTPAYAVDDYSSMGLRVINPFNKNMLTQEATSVTYVVNPTITDPVKESDFTKIGVMTASAQTWIKNGTGIVYPITIPQTQQNYSSLGIWLKGTSYSWIGDETAELSVEGRYPYSAFQNFNFTTNSNPQWQLDEQITGYDVYSHPLESKDLFNKYGAILMDPLCVQVTASANLASRAEIAYSGSEFNEYYKFSEGTVSFGDGAVSINNAHTGKNSLEVGSGNKKGYSFSFIPIGTRNYHASVWVYQPGGVKADGSTFDFSPKLIAKNKITGEIIATGMPSESQKARGFYRLAIDIIPTNNTDAIEVYCQNQNTSTDKPQYFDDFRVHPLDAGFTSYVYDLDKGLLTYILDGDNLYTRYEYDHANKLVAVYKELFRVNEKIVTTSKYNYGKQ